MLVWFTIGIWAQKKLNKSSGPNKIPSDLIAEVYQRDQSKCTNCGADQRINIYHISPVTEGRSQTADNLFLLCEECSKNKDDIKTDLKPAVKSGFNWRIAFRIIKITFAIIGVLFCWFLAALDPVLLFCFILLVGIVFVIIAVKRHRLDPNYIPSQVIDEVQQRDQFKCINCGAKAALPHAITPLSEGGSRTAENFVLLCFKCLKNKEDIITDLKADLKEVESDIETIFTQDDKAGYIYILINASLQENTIKIGRTKRDPKERAKELSVQTGLPSEFIVAYSQIVNDDKKAESLIHRKLNKHRVTGLRKDRNREFFSLPLEQAIKVVNDVVNKIGQPNYLEMGAKRA
jgi:5-methylcytosine-specific restriction endonuclease McrA